MQCKIPTIVSNSLPLMDELTPSPPGWHNDRHVSVDSVLESILQIDAGGTSILMVEGDAVKALKNCHRRYVLEMGNNRFEGNAKDLLENGEVRRLYLRG